jgi:hypothetical protein
MYVETDIITSILVTLSGQMYVETDIITSILVSLSGKMYVETDIIIYPDRLIRILVTMSVSTFITNVNLYASLICIYV